MKRLAMVALVLVSAGCSDSVTERYATIGDARKAGLFERGWLPNALPSSTQDIEARNDLDLNMSVGEFVVSRSDLDVFTARLRPYSAEAADADTHLVSYLQAKEKEGLRVGVLEEATSVWAFVCDPKTARCIYRLISER
jgi:hypothetical protein